MRIPTIMQYKTQTNSISRQTEDVDTLNQRINSGKKLINSSDDPILAQRIKSTQDYINQIQAFEQNTTIAANRTNLLEASTQRSLDAVGRIRELIRGAQSDTASPVDRQNIVRELRGLLNNVAAYANTKDSSGEYIFSGTSTTTRPFASVNGVYQYVGSQEAVSINISETISQLYGESGQRIFGDIRLGNGDFTIQQSSTPNTGTAETSVGAITNQTQYVEDTYTLTFVTNSNGRIGYQIVGSSSGQVIPTPPATTPTNAPDYASGDAITFNGLTFTVSGAPAVNDSFVISPSGNQNALETINQLINTIGTPITNDVDKAAYHQLLSQLSASMDQISDHLTNYLSEIGYRNATIDTEVDSNKNIVDNQTIILGKLSNADQTQLLTDFKQKMLNLELTSQSYSKLSELFTELLKTSF